MQVRPADAAGAHSQQHKARLRLGARHILDLEGAAGDISWRGQDSGFHQVLPPELFQISGVNADREKSGDTPVCVCKCGCLRSQPGFFRIRKRRLICYAIGTSLKTDG